MAQPISSRSGTWEDLRRHGNCFVWTGSAASAAFGHRPKPEPKTEPAADTTPRPETPATTDDATRKE